MPLLIDPLAAHTSNEGLPRRGFAGDLEPFAVSGCCAAHIGGRTGTECGELCSMELHFEAILASRFLDLRA